MSDNPLVTAINYGTEVILLREMLAKMRRERDALAAKLEKRKACKKCGGTGRYLAYPPTTYETDTEDEVTDAIRMAERPCPECSIDPAAILREREAQAVADYVARHVCNPVAIVDVSAAKALENVLNQIVCVVEHWADENTSSEAALNKIHSLADEAIVDYRAKYGAKPKENPTS